MPSAFHANEGTPVFAAFISRKLLCVGACRSKIAAEFSISTVDLSLT